MTLGCIDDNTTKRWNLPSAATGAIRCDTTASDRLGPFPRPCGYANSHEN